MIERYWKKKVLQVGLETVYGTPPAAMTAIKAFDVNITPLEAQEVQQETAAPWMGAGETYLVGQMIKMDFAINIAGSGTPDLPPPFAPLLKFSGFREIITAGESVEYLPISQSFDSGALRLNIDGVIHSGVGARGSVQAVLGANAIPQFKFSLVGLYQPVTDGALPVVDFSAWKTSVLPNRLSTPVVKIHGQAVSLLSATFSNGANPQHKPRVNSESITITDHPATAEWSIDEPTLADLDLYAAAVAGTRGPLVLEHGTVAGNIFIASAPFAQVTKVSKSNNNGSPVLAVGFSLKPGLGNDELSFKFK